MNSDSAWHPENKTWLATRKGEWRRIAANLGKLEGEFPRRGHGFHKELFFYGRLDPVLFDSWQMAAKGIRSPFGGALPLFEMWYHPEPSREVFEAIVERQTSAQSLRESARVLFHYGVSHFSDTYGMLGGREELVVAVLYPVLDYQEIRVMKDGSKFNLAPHPAECRRAWLSAIRVLLRDFPGNPYAPGQYLWDHLSYNLEHYPDEMADGYRQEPELRRAAMFADIREALRLILDFDVRANALRNDPQRVAVRQRALERLEAREFGPTLMRLWDEEKAVFAAVGST